MLVANAPDSAARDFAGGPEFRFRPGAPDDLAHQVDAPFDTPGLLAAGARRSLERARQPDFASSTRNLEMVYERVISQHTTPPDRRARGVA